MSKTRPKQGIEQKGGYCSNVSKTILKQGTEGGLGYFANRPMTIGKSEFEGGMATCAHKWKTAEICKRESSGRLHAENKKHYCGAPPPPGECWSGLNPPILSTYNEITGATTNMLRKENLKKRHSCQEKQGPQSYWSTHEVKFRLPAELPPPGKHQNNMCPQGLAVHNPTNEILLKYSTVGCPVKTGLNWNKEEIHAAVMRVPHKSALAEEAISHFAAEAKEKVASNQARLV